MSGTLACRDRYQPSRIAPMKTKLWLRLSRRRRRKKRDDYDTPEAAERRKRAHDAWRSRNAWNHGDPPGIGGL
jgi:hypothetical protein